MRTGSRFGWSLLLCVCAAAQGAELTVRTESGPALVLKAEDLAKMPHETVSVPAPDGTRVAYEGVRLREILLRAGVPRGKNVRGKELTTYVLAKARDGYQVVFSLGEIAADLGNEAIVVVDSRAGKALDEKEGPLRLICPNDSAGSRSVRMLESLDVVQLQR